MLQRDTNKAIMISVLVVLVILVLWGAWYLSDKLAQLESQNATLVEQTEQAALANSDLSLDTAGNTNSSRTNVNREIITGQAHQPSAGDDIRIGCYVFADSVQEIWVHYGNTLAPQEQTNREPVELETEENVYSRATVTIPNPSIDPAKIYTYRCAGTASGKTVQGGITSFTSHQQQ